MKLINKNLIVAMAAVALFAFSGTAQAQYKAVGDDGIAASPKVRSMMKPISSPADVAGLKDGDMVAMACPKCKTIMVTHVKTDKGHVKTTTTVP